MRIAITLSLLAVNLAGCCPWAEWQPCRREARVEDTGGQPVDSTVIIKNRLTGEEFSRSDCPGTCFVEVTDLFHNGEWSSWDGIIIRAEAPGKLAYQVEGECRHDGMHITDPAEPGVLVFVMEDVP